MSITILHSPFNEASLTFLATLGIAPQGEDVTVDINGTAVRVVSNHELAAGIAAFGDYPALVYAPGEAVYVLNRPASWQECLDFMAAPSGAESEAPAKGPTNLTKLDFLDLFTDTELKSLKGLEASSLDVALFWERYRAAQYMNLADPRTIASINALEATGLIATGRAAQILSNLQPVE